LPDAALVACWFAEPVNVGEATVASLRLLGCHLPGLQAWQLTTKGNLGLNYGFTARELVLLAPEEGVVEEAAELGKRRWAGFGLWLNDTVVILLPPDALEVTGAARE
jgi:hypothetical protein